MVKNSGAAWVYCTYLSDTPSDAFGPMSPIVALWRSKAPASGGFPMWRDFDILDFEGWWGQLSLAELHRDPVDVRWVLWGSILVEWWGKEYTNQLISEQPYLGDTWEKVERPYLERLIDERMIGFVSGTLKPQNRDFLHIDGIDLPLEKDGVITHILSAYRLRGRDDVFVSDAPTVYTF